MEMLELTGRATALRSSLENGAWINGEATSCLPG